MRSKKELIALYKEQHGAGFQGTDELVKKYKKDTPGQRKFKIHKLKVS